jgi:hypothetical protein
MTLITTSRRSTPVIRRIAKDLVFATGCTYLSRGKAGIRDIAQISPYFFIISEIQNARIRIQLFHQEIALIDCVVTELQSKTREWALFRGIRTSNVVYEAAIKKACSCDTLLFEADISVIAYDGPQKRHHTLTVEAYDDAKMNSKKGDR